MIRAARAHRLCVGRENTDKGTIAHSEQPRDFPRPIGFRFRFARRGLAPARQRLGEDEGIRRADPFVFVVDAPCSDSSTAITSCAACRGAGCHSLVYRPEGPGALTGLEASTAWRFWFGCSLSLRPLASQASRLPSLRPPARLDTSSATQLHRAQTHERAKGAPGPAPLSGGLVDTRSAWMSVEAIESFTMFPVFPIANRLFVALGRIRAKILD